ncbi:MAG: DNA-3-methyladenine glycosylase 2 family protein [Sphingomonadales bacterium]|jgi:DNA-3-methyladenine glycosylase II
MSLTKDILHSAIQEVAQTDQHVADAVSLVGLPEERVRGAGFASLLRILVGQQLSIKAAASIWTKFETLLGDISPERVLNFEIEELRSAGLSRQKALYARAMSEAIVQGGLDLENLSQLDDESARSHICAVKGLGPWTADIYLLFCDGRHDIWPSGDLALQVALGRLKGLKDRPTAKETVPLVEPWRPHRGAMAVFLWHYYAQSDAPV